MRDVQVRAALHPRLLEARRGALGPAPAEHVVGRASVSVASQHGDAARERVLDAEGQPTEYTVEDSSDIIG